MIFFTTGWPYLGLALAVALLAVLLFTPFGQGARPGPRFRDVGWLAWAGLPLYMLHQFEEHGIDALGHAYAFRGSMCAALGFPVPDLCPVPTSFITAVNLGTVWGAALICALVGPRKPLVALAAYGVPLINAVAHIASAVGTKAYNPGLVSAVLLFLPACAWTLHVALVQRAIGKRGVAVIVLAGVVVHVVLMGSLKLFIAGGIAETSLALIQVANMAVPVGLAWFASGWAAPRQGGG
jgi:hypothetical protein